MSSFHDELMQKLVQIKQGKFFLCWFCLSPFLSFITEGFLCYEGAAVPTAFFKVQFGFVNYFGCNFYFIFITDNLSVLSRINFVISILLAVISHFLILVNIIIIQQSWW